MAIGSYRKKVYYILFKETKSKDRKIKALDKEGYGTFMISYIVYQNPNHIVDVDVIFPVFNKELLYFFEGAGQPNKNEVCS